MDATKSNESLAKDQAQRFPIELHYGQGLSITAEDLVAKSALLNLIIGGFLDDAAKNIDREPLSFPEANGLFELSSTIYHALNENVYREFHKKEVDHE